jgi:hypothetical protein
LVGTSATRMATVKYRLGEWCTPEFPLSNDKLLIRVTDDGHAEWSLLYPLAGGDYEFEVKSFSNIGAVKIGSLKVRDGRASLSELVHRLGR